MSVLDVVKTRQPVEITGTPTSIPNNAAPIPGPQLDRQPSILPAQVVAELGKVAGATPGVHMPSYVAGLHDGAHALLGMVNPKGITDPVQQGINPLDNAPPMNTVQPSRPNPTY